MSERRATLPFADLLALAILEHGPASGSELARRVKVRKRTVLDELRTSPRFERIGSGPGSRWRLASQRSALAPWEPMGTGSYAQDEESVGQNGSDRLAALERRVAELERSLAGREASA